MQMIANFTVRFWCTLTRLSWPGALLGWLVGGLCALLGGWDGLVDALVFMVVVDFLTGTGLAWKHHRLRSRRMREGVVVKLGYFVLVAVAYRLDMALTPDVPMIHAMTTTFLIAVDALSIIENLAGIGVPIPPGLIQRLHRIKDAAGDLKTEEGEHA